MSILTVQQRKAVHLVFQSFMTALMCFLFVYHMERSLGVEWIRRKCYFLNCRTVLMYVLFLQSQVRFFCIFGWYLPWPGCTKQRSACLNAYFTLVFCCFVHEGKQGNLIPPIRQPGLCGINRDEQSMKLLLPIIFVLPCQREQLDSIYRFRYATDYQIY